MSSGVFGDFEGVRPVHDIVIVLVEPRDGRNVGAVARAMSNLGFGCLRLVAPGDFNAPLASNVACWGADVVQRAETFTCLREAVSDTHEVVGFASDSGSHRIPQRLLDEYVGSLVQNPGRRIAFVFGSEENGLRREHFPICHYLVRIPSVLENRSYNLAQSVLLALYSLRRSSASVIGTTDSELPTSSHLDDYTSMVLRVAETAGFLTEHSPDHIRDLLVNVTKRGRLTSRELKVLTGLFGRIEKALRGKVPLNLAEGQ